MDRINLGTRVKQLRLNAALTLRALSERSAVSMSTLSKIENDQLSPTYDTLLKLARGLSLDLSGLLSDERTAPPRGRRSVTRRGEGKLFVNENYDYEVLCTELQTKLMQPIKARLKAGTRQEFGPLITHDGEELVYVLSGEVELLTEFYEPIRLAAGDCTYYDSTMGHALLSVGSEDAEVFWVSTDLSMVPSVKQIQRGRLQRSRRLRRPQGVRTE